MININSLIAFQHHWIFLCRSYRRFFFILLVDQQKKAWIQLLFRKSLALLEIILKVVWGNSFMWWKLWDQQWLLIANWQCILETLDERNRSISNRHVPDKNSPLFFPKKRDSGLSPYPNGKLEILLSSPKRRCLQNGTFEEKLSFRQNSLSLGFSYGKAAEKQSWESITEERVHHTLPRRGSSVKGLAKDEKNGGPQKQRASVEALPRKRVLSCKVGCCFANCSRRKRVPSNSPWIRVLANKRWLHVKGTSSLELSLKRVLRKRKRLIFLIKW